MAIASFQQDPTARLDYAIDWSKYLEAGDSVASYTVRLDEPASGIAVEQPVALQGNTTIVWVSTTGADPGKYLVVVHVVTAAAREDERSISITVKDQ